jgi:antitoxin FitA
MTCIVRCACSPPSTATAPRPRLRDILERAVKPARRVRLGDALAALGRKVGLTDEDVAIIDQMRDNSPAKPMQFEC